MKEYVGRFPINKALTKKLNVKNWVVYRDNEIGGIYLLNTIVGEEIMTLFYNETAKSVTEATLEEWRVDIRDRQAEWDEMIERNSLASLGGLHAKYIEDLKREKASR